VKLKSTLVHATTATALVLLAGCAQSPPPPPTTQAQAEADEALQQADGVSGATAVAVPVARWLGAVILQMFQNVKLNVDVKLDNPQKATP
jgi:hypothetical protein